MVRSIPDFYRAHYQVQNVPAVSRALRGLSEFSWNAPKANEEEFVWMVPSSRRRQAPQAVATVKLGEARLCIESQSRPALRAMQVLVESLVDGHLTPVPAE